MAEKRTEAATRQDRPAAVRERSARRVDLFDRFADEMERIFDDFGFGRSSLHPRSGHWFGRPASEAHRDTWAPELEMVQRNNELVVRADLPGMKKEDIVVDVTDDGITISGERHQEHEEDRGGVFRSERSYGSFWRFVPLPPGAMADQAKASFKDGVLEIAMPAPPDQVTRGRRLEIGDASDARK
ncbi:MAG TPA: Hsp20/alpha crystallin family protein [Vicinamibacterales bacterium]|nr:Hsp20/alpha crystallin family protein [Vicinamibacterales bacterium]